MLNNLEALTHYSSQPAVVPDPIWSEPKPLPDPLPKAPSLDSDLAKKMIPAGLLDFIQDISEMLNVPMESVAVATFTGMAAVIGRKIGLHPKRFDNWQVVGVLWCMIVARPGEKKSALISKALQFLAHLEALERERYQEALAGSKADESVMKARLDAIKEGIKQAVKDGDEEQISSLRTKLQGLEEEQQKSRLILKRLKINDSTTEKIVELLMDNPSLLVNRDELSGFLESCEKQGREGDRAFYLEAWNGTGSFDVDRIGRGSIHVEALCVSILGGIQPGKLAKYVSDTLKGGSGDDGFLSRFNCSVYPERTKYRPVDRYADKEARARVLQIAEKLSQLDAIALGAVISDDQKVPALRFDPEGQEVFDQWLATLEKRLCEDDTLDPALEAHLSKYRSLMPTLALVFHLVDWASGQTVGQGVSALAARRAAAWCEFLEGHALKIYSYGLRSDRFAAHALMRKIKSGDVKDGMTIRDIYRHQWTSLASSEAVEGAAAILEECGWVVVQHAQPAKGGAPRAILRINPKYKRVDA